MIAQKRNEWIRRLGNLRIKGDIKEAVDLEYAYGFTKVCAAKEADPYQLLHLANTLELKL